MTLALCAPALAQGTLPEAPSAERQPPPAATQPQPAQPAPEATKPAEPAQFKSLAPSRNRAAATAPANTPAEANATPESDTKQQPSTPTGTPQQTPEGTVTQTDEGDYTVRTGVDEVNVIFTVTDRRGKFVKNLTKEQIRVLDDKKPPRSISDFRTQTDLPLRVGLLVDASTSIRERFKFEQEAAIEFLAQIIRPKVDKAFIMGFDVVPEVTADFTNRTDQLAEGVRALRPGGGTAMYDALYLAAREKLGKLKEREPVRKAVILLSDGEDNQSRVTREEAIEMAQRAEIIVYCISTNLTNTSSRGDKVLERIAEATGGRVFFPFKIEQVADAFTDIQDELRSQYSVAYKPADFNRDGRFRTIEIASVNSKYKIRARKGYYAPR